MAEANPVGVREIAERLGVKRQTVALWHHKGMLPERRWTVSGSPAWDWPDIQAWAAQSGRTKGTKTDDGNG